MIHGLPNGEGWIGAAHRLFDWTLGCIAVTDEEIDEVFKLVAVGTPVEIRPYKQSCIFSSTIRAAKSPGQKA